MKLFSFARGCLLSGAHGLKGDDTASVSINEWPVPWPDNPPRDLIWFFETRSQPNQLVRFDPRTEEFFIRIPVPSGGGSVRHMANNRKRNSLWFGTDTNKLGQVRLF